MSAVGASEKDPPKARDDAPWRSPAYERIERLVKQRYLLAEREAAMESEERARNLLSKYAVKQFSIPLLPAKRRIRRSLCSACTGKEIPLLRLKDSLQKLNVRRSICFCTFQKKITALQGENSHLRSSVFGANLIKDDVRFFTGFPTLASFQTVLTREKPCV